MNLGMWLAALGVGIWFICEVVHIISIHHSLHDELLRLETGRALDRPSSPNTAALRAEMYRLDRTGRLVIHNAGQVEALSVHIAVDGTPIDQHQLFPRSPQPLAVIGPNARVGFLMMTHDGAPSSYRVELRWDDASGRPGNWASALTLAH